MRSFLNFAFLIFTLPVFSQEFDLPHKISCEGSLNNQYIGLEFLGSESFKKFATAQDKLSVQLIIEDETFEEILRYPNYRFEEASSDDDLSIMFFTAVKERNSLGCLFKNCPVKDLSFNIKTSDNKYAQGVLYFQLKKPYQKLRDYSVEIDCKLL